MAMKIPEIKVGDVLTLKKNHPCSPSSKTFEVLRVGSDIRIKCTVCGHDMTIPREKIESSIRAIDTRNRKQD